MILETKAILYARKTHYFLEFGQPHRAGTHRASGKNYILSMYYFPHKLRFLVDRLSTLATLFPISFCHMATNPTNTLLSSKTLICILQIEQILLATYLAVPAQKGLKKCELNSHVDTLCRYCSLQTS